MANTICCGPTPSGSAGPNCEAGDFWSELCYRHHGDPSNCRRHGWRHFVVDQDCSVSVEEYFASDRVTPIDPGTFVSVACPSVIDLSCGAVDAIAEALAPAKYDSIKLCDPASGLPVIVVVGYDADGVPTATAYTVSGAQWSGDIDSLVPCDTPELESDPIDWCIDGKDYTQYVVKRDGMPTGSVIWTDPSGAVVADPIPSATLAQKGACHLVNVPIDVPMCLPE